MGKVYELFDDKTDKCVFVGTEPECIKYSIEHPDVKFYWEIRRDWEVRDDKRKNQEDN